MTTSLVKPFLLRLIPFLVDGLRMVNAALEKGEIDPYDVVDLQIEAEKTHRFGPRKP